MKFIRVANTTTPSDILKYLYSDLTIPKLIISVTGGAKTFTIPHRIKKAFKEGIIKAAATTDAWIITGGTNTGVMRLVGEAVAEEYPTYSLEKKLTVLGIATWGVIYDRKLLERELEHKEDYVEERGKEKRDVLLDPNHNNFILVDDGSERQFGREIDFRISLETFINKEKEVPTVLIVVNGGPNTLETVAKSMDNDIPVLILSVNINGMPF